MKKGFLLSLTLLLVNAISAQEQSLNTLGKQKLQPVFSKGQKGSVKNFTGNAYNHPLIENDSVMTILGGEVYFEPGARSNWHTHPAGQILVVTAGVGYHQIEGQSIQIIQKGVTIKCPPNTPHWHGASKDQGMAHIYLLPNTEKGIVNWGRPVTDEEYQAANN